MRKAILKKLILENFKGRTMSLDFSDNSVIKGTNKAGKSTLTNAFFWLLTGVDAQDRANHKLYDVTKEFTPENATLAVVEGLFDIDGVEYSFKRTAKQKWYRPRGKAEYVKDKSDEYAFYIDGLAVSANIYKERIEALFAPMDKLKLMLNVRYYQTLDWKKLRKQFSDIVGEIKSEELAGDYSAIAPLLAKFEKDPTFRGNVVDAVKEKLKQEMVPLNDALKSLDFEIKGMKACLPSMEGVVEAEALIGEKTERIDEIEKLMLGISDSNRPLIEKRKEYELLIIQKETALEKERMDWDNEQNKEIEAIKAKIADVNSHNATIIAKNNSVNSQRKNIETQLEMARQHAKFLDEEIVRLRKENSVIKERTFDENQVCPNCGQILPDDKIAELKAAFYNKRDADHEACVERGLRLKDKIASHNELIESLERSLAELPALQKVVSLESLELELANAISQREPFENSPLYDIMQNHIELLKSQTPVVPETDSAALLEEKKKLMSEIAELSVIANRRDSRKNCEAIISDKEDEISQTGIKLSRLEGLFNKCIEREREWASIVRDRANKYLGYAHVEMTELTKAGELNDVCVLTAQEVSSDTQNNATQILIGIDLARAFQRNAGIYMPLFIDNAEGIVNSNMPTVENQMITLYVDENYPQLTVV